MQKNNSLIEFRHVRKVFGDCVANDDLSFSVMPGTIHAIIGENGAGKSTAMKMLYGLYPPSAGEIFLRGKPVHFPSPRDAIAQGVGMVHQHFMLAEPHSVLDNILLGAEGVGAFSFMKRLSASRRLHELMNQYGLNVGLNRTIAELSVGEEQRVEILKLLYRNSEILILDEPTAVLTPQEITALFANLRKMRNEGKTILIITHKLREVMALADQVTVMKAGRVSGERSVSSTSAEELAELMVGRKVNLRVDAGMAPPVGASILSVRNLRVGAKEKAVIPKLSLEVNAGEIVGIAGVEGNGQSELLRAILFAKEKAYRFSGDISIRGALVNSFSCEEIRKLGVALLAENRLKESLLLSRPMTENFLLGHHHRAEFSSKGILQSKVLEERLESAIAEYDIRPPLPTALAAALSGGNQQKLVVARELMHEPKLLIAAQPTRGVDIGAVEFIHKKILALRKNGAGVLLVSSELEEVLTLSDRILVMYEGEIVAEFTRSTADESKIGFYMGGGKEKTA